MQSISEVILSKRPFKINSIPYSTFINIFYIHLRIMYTLNTLHTTRIYIYIATDESIAMAWTRAIVFYQRSFQGM